MVLPAGVVASSDTIGIDFVVDALGVPWVGKLMAFFVAASTAGACNASVLSGARVTYSAAREKQVHCTTPPSQPLPCHADELCVKPVPTRLWLLEPSCCALLGPHLPSRVGVHFAHCAAG